MRKMRVYVAELKRRFTVAVPPGYKVLKRGLLCPLDMVWTYQDRDFHWIDTDFYTGETGDAECYYDYDASAFHLVIRLNDIASRNWWWWIIR